jgi:hypothetical protein
MGHYSCHQVYFSATVQERIVDTIEFMPEQCKVPGLSIADASAIAASDVAHTLLHPAPLTHLKQPGSERMQAIRELAAMFDKMSP